MIPSTRLRLLATLKVHEGLRLQAYDDATGKPATAGSRIQGNVTVGYGRNLIGRGLTLPEANHLLDNDVDEVVSELDKRMPYWRTWTEPRQWGIAELGFNLGVSNFVMTWPTTVSMLKAGLFEQAAGNLERSLWRRQVGERRALPIIRAIRTGSWT